MTWRRDSANEKEQQPDELDLKQKQGKEYVCKDDETVAMVAAKLGIHAHEIMRLNKGRYKGLTVNARLFRGKNFCNGVHTYINVLSHLHYKLSVVRISQDTLLLLPHAPKESVPSPSVNGRRYARKTDQQPKTGPEKLAPEIIQQDYIKIISSRRTVHTIIHSMKHLRYKI